MKGLIVVLAVSIILNIVTDCVLIAWYGMLSVIAM